VIIELTWTKELESFDEENNEIGIWIEMLID